MFNWFELYYRWVPPIFLLAPHFQYIYPERRTFYCVRIFGIYFFNFSIVVLLTKLNRRLLKTMAFS